MANISLLNFILLDAQEEFYADDLQPPAGADRWDHNDLRRFFSEGGSWTPQSTSAPEVKSPMKTRKQMIWDNAPCRDALLSLSLTAAQESQHSEGVTRIRCISSSNLVLSGSWDATAKLWRLPESTAEDETMTLDCVLHDPNSKRWVYDTASFWFGDTASPDLGVVTAHTGGMSGEPEQVLQPSF